MSKQEWRMAQRVKPVGVDGIAAIVKIAEEGFGKVNEVGVDSFSAGAVKAVWEGLNEANRVKLAGLPVVVVCKICLKLCRVAA